MATFNIFVTLGISLVNFKMTGSLPNNSSVGILTGLC